MSDQKLIWDYWEHYAFTCPEQEAIVHWDVLQDPVRWTYGELHKIALCVAQRLLLQGVRPGEVCALLIKHNAYFYPLYMGIVAMGAVPAVLAYPNPRLHPEKFFQGLFGIAKKSGLDWVLTEEALKSAVVPIFEKAHAEFKGVLFPLDWFKEPVSFSGDSAVIKEGRPKTSEATVLLQHSSGTTGLQKAVVLSHDAVIGHIKTYAQAINLSERDKVISWLPLYHDMGLIAAFHLPLLKGIPTIQIDPFQWVLSPGLLFQVISQEGATLSWLPNFSYNFLAERVQSEDLKGVDLSGVRMLINSSEVVRSESQEAFLRRFREFGLREDALSACYAMAEATFSVTQVPPGIRAREIVLDRDALAQKKVWLVDEGRVGKRCVSSGLPLEGVVIEICDEGGVLLPSGMAGNIVVRSPALFDGYKNNPERTNHVLRNGSYVTGDLGFLLAGECFVIGRADDVIIIAGKNVFPEDIENAVCKVPGVIPGRVVAFGVANFQTGTEDICVLVESDNSVDKSSLILAIKQAGMAVDVTIAVVCVEQARWLIKSSSGKISRRANKERYLASLGASGV